MSGSIGEVAHELFDGSALRKALRNALKRIESRVDELNRLNVFPVPDGDTGVNMMLTLRAANRAIDSLSSNSAGVVAATAARGALLGASGNSGVILAQILRGIARGLEMKDQFSPSHFAEALHAAAESAYRAVTNPTEGTILTVSREVARIAISMAERGAGFREMMNAIVAQAKSTVKRTPEMLPQLKEAGVEDAGAKGLFYILQGIKDAVSNRISSGSNRAPRRPRKTRILGDSGQKVYGFDVQFLVKGRNLDLDEMRRHIERMGESVLVVGDGDVVRVHIHTFQPEPVLQYARSVGEVDNIEIQDMDEQVAVARGVPGGGERGSRPRHKKG